MANHNTGKPLVSIITLVYNTGNYVVKALESVKSQEYDNVQHIIIDDCSSDNSVEIVDSWSNRNLLNFTFIKHPKNLGVTKSMNEGLRLAKGKYVSFVSDDLFLPGKLNRQVQMFEGLGVDYGLVYSDIQMTNDEGESFGTLFGSLNRFEIGPEDNLVEELFLGHFIHGSAALLRNDSLKEIGYFNETFVVEDIDLYLRLASKYKFKFDNEISAIYRIHDQSLLKTIGTKGLEQNLLSLEPYCRYSDKTLAHFIKYLDSCLQQFSSEEYLYWRKWFKKRWSYKKDLVSLSFYLIAVLNIKLKYLNKVKSLLNFSKLKRSWFSTMVKVKSKLFPKPWNEKFIRISYSQCAEDLLVQYVFLLRNINNPTYLDIGANHPYYLSNTALFYQHGSRGINIEANPLLHDAFTFHRPNDINLNIGISDKEEDLDFYIMSDNTLSTFSKEECDQMLSNGQTLNKVEKVKLTTIDRILDAYCNGVFPDFLSIDVEGLDFQILKSIDYGKSSPKVICVEAAEYSPKGSGARRNDLIDFLVGKGYYEYANTNLNAIIVKRDFWFV